MSHLLTLVNALAYTNNKILYKYIFNILFYIKQKSERLYEDDPNPILQKKL